MCLRDSNLSENCYEVLIVMCRWANEKSIVFLFLSIRRDIYSFILCTFVSCSDRIDTGQFLPLRANTIYITAHTMSTMRRPNGRKAESNWKMDDLIIRPTCSVLRKRQRNRTAAFRWVECFHFHRDLIIFRALFFSLSCSSFGHFHYLHFVMSKINISKICT